MYDDQAGADGYAVIAFGWRRLSDAMAAISRDASGAVRKAISGYSLKPGSRPSSAAIRQANYRTACMSIDFEFTMSRSRTPATAMVVGGQLCLLRPPSLSWVIKCFFRHAGFSSFAQAKAPEPEASDVCRTAWLATQATIMTGVGAAITAAAVGHRQRQKFHFPSCNVIRLQRRT